MNNDGMGIDLFYPKIGTHAVKFEDNVRLHHQLLHQ